MAVEKGKKYYFIVHAYYHYIGEVVEVLGPRRVVLNNVVQIHSCRRNWTLFFKDGMKNDTSYDVLPDGKEVEYFSADPWCHSIPTEK